MMPREDYAAPCLVCAAAADYARYTCQRCPEKMRRQLGEIDTYYNALDAEPVRSGPSERSAPGFRSRPPGRLDVIASRDRRSLPYAVGADDEDASVRPVRESLHMLALWIAEEAGDEPRPPCPTVTTESGYLRGRVEWCTGREWVDELAADIVELHRQCAQMAGDGPEPPVGQCECGGMLFARGQQVLSAVTCGQCSTVYSGVEILRAAQRVTAA